MNQAQNTGLVKEPIQFLFTNPTIPKVENFSVESDELMPSDETPLDDLRDHIMEELQVPESVREELK